MGHSSPRSFCLPQRTGLRNTGNNLSFAMCTGLAFQSCLAENPSNIHFIEQMGGLDGMLKGTSLHLSTSFSTGAVFSDTFLDSLLATVGADKPECPPSPRNKPLMERPQLTVLSPFKNFPKGNLSTGILSGFHIFKTTVLVQVSHMLGGSELSQAAFPLL
jgi:hypothetical protein